MAIDNMDSCKHLPCINTIGVVSGLLYEWVEGYVKLVLRIVDKSKEFCIFCESLRSFGDFGRVCGVWRVLWVVMGVIGVFLRFISNKKSHVKSFIAINHILPVFMGQKNV